MRKAVTDIINNAITSTVSRTHDYALVYADDGNRDAAVRWSDTAQFCAGADHRYLFLASIRRYWCRVRWQCGWAKREHPIKVVKRRKRRWYKLRRCRVTSLQPRALFCLPRIWFMELFKFLIDFILHIDRHLLELVRDYGNWVLRHPVPDRVLRDRVGGIACCRAIRCCLSPARWHHAGALEVHGLALALMLAAILGDSLNYAIGKAFRSPDRRAGFTLGEAGEHLQRTHAFFEKHTAARPSSLRASCRLSAHLRAIRRRHRRDELLRSSLSM